MGERSVRRLVMASVAGLVAAGAWLTGGGSVQAHGEQGTPCYGINKCKGVGDCGGKGHGCHGQNMCKGQGFIVLEQQEDCLKIANGRLTPETAPEKETDKPHAHDH